MVQALVEAYARRAGIPPADLWSYLDRRAAPPPELRDAIVAAFFPRVPPDSFLTASANIDTLDTDMQATTEPRRGRPLTQRKHPFVRALIREGLTIAEVADELKAKQSTVKAWYKKVGTVAHRPIPKAMAERIRDRFKVPLSAWDRIAE
jgi:DNA-binding NarL/FixJ family response regulator